MNQAIHDPNVITHNIFFGGVPVGRQGFSVPMLAGPASFTEQFKIYENDSVAIAAAVTAGDITQAVADYITDGFSTGLKPSRVIYGKVRPSAQQVVLYTFTGMDDGEYTINVNGVDYSYTASGDVVSTITSNLETDINAANLGITATATATEIELEADVAGVGYTTSATSTGSPVTRADVQENISLSGELTAIYAANPSFFGFSLVSRQDLEIEEAFEWARVNGRFCSAETNTLDVANKVAGSLALRLQEKGEQYGVLSYNDVESTKAWKWLCNRASFSLDEKSPTWSFVQLNDQLTKIDATQKQNLREQNVAHYLTFKTVPCMLPSKTPSGIPVERVWTAAWVKARLDEAMAQAIINAANDPNFGKIGYDDLGGAQLEGIGLNVLLQGEAADHFQEGSSRIVFKRISETSQALRDQEVFSYTYGALFRGSVKGLLANGTLTTDAEVLNSLFPAEDN